MMPNQAYLAEVLAAMKVPANRNDYKVQIELYPSSMMIEFWWQKAGGQYASTYLYLSLDEFDHKISREQLLQDLKMKAAEFLEKMLIADAQEIRDKERAAKEKAQAEAAALETKTNSLLESVPDDPTKLLTKGD